MITSEKAKKKKKMIKKIMRYDFLPCDSRHDIRILLCIVDIRENISVLREALQVPLTGP